MAEDPYKTLGVARDAKEAEIRRAYRKLAKQFHPDLNPGDKSAEERFKAVSAANEMLSDPETRGRYDRGEIDASGAERPQPRGWRQYADTGNGERPNFNGGQGGTFGAENFEDLFSSLFTQRGSAGSMGPRPGSMRGRDEHYTLTAKFLDAVNGATTRLALPDGQTLDVKIPPGTMPGQMLRLRGRGSPGVNGGAAGDAIIDIQVAPHRFFRRDGQDIRLDLPITVREAVLGAKVTVPTPGGPVAMTVKPGTDTGTELRLRGRGVPAHGNVPAGDLFLRLSVVIGQDAPALADLLRDLPPPAGYDPRAGMEGGE
jgi:DnaJ-class molecular chaperone